MLAILISYSQLRSDMTSLNESSKCQLHRFSDG